MYKSDSGEIDEEGVISGREKTYSLEVHRSGVTVQSIC